MKEAKKWLKRFIIALALVIGAFAAVVIIIDPYLHYHKPLSFISYRYHDQRYINDGIARHYDYDAVIIGTSMTENFKTSEWEKLTGERTIKLPVAGGDFMEMREQLERAFSYNPEIRTIIWGIDYDALVRPYDFHSYDNYPTYLYDNNPFNDVEYVLNKDVLYKGVLADLERTIKGEPTETLDSYSSWNIEGGLEHIMLNYNRLPEAKEMEPDLPKEQEIMVLENVVRNLSDFADAHPDVTFLLFYPPYGIVHWDMCNREGWTLRHFEAEQIATEELLKHDNIKLYNFFDNFELTCNLENYKDPEHYVAGVNSWILTQLLNDEWLVTEDNYMERMKKAHDFYYNYDFETIFTD
jgi:hypothetical protein